MMQKKKIFLTKLHKDYALHISQVIHVHTKDFFENGTNITVIPNALNLHPKV